MNEYEVRLSFKVDAETHYDAQMLANQEVKSFRNVSEEAYCFCVLTVEEVEE